MRALNPLSPQKFKTGHSKAVFLSLFVITVIVFRCSASTRLFVRFVLDSLMVICSEKAILLALHLRYFTHDVCSFPAWCPEKAHHVDVNCIGF